MEVLRLDCIHPLVSGNKWFKLKLNLQQAQSEGYERVLSFGGAYSNHLRALAAAARLAGMESIGIVRGELPDPLNPVLAFARQQGMELHAVTRGDYRKKQQVDFIAGLVSRFGDFFLIPEGGSNQLGVLGCGQIMEHLKPELLKSENQTTVVAAACGTGATLAGLIRGAQQYHLANEFVGVAVLKGADFLHKDIRQWLGPEHQSIKWQLNTACHCGGYARCTPELTEFVASFQGKTGIPLEPVYTGKLVYALYSMIESGAIAKGSRVIWLHTGGIY